MKYFVFVVIFFNTISIAQLNQRIVTFFENETIAKVDESDSSIVLKTYVKLYGNKIYVYDKKGNEKLRFDKINWISGAFISNDNNLIVCYSRGEVETDIVESIDIRSKKKKWEIKINAGDFSISQDKSKLITKRNPLLKSGNFEILNLEDGSKRKTTIQSNSFCAEWLDNNRVVLVYRKQFIKKKNPNYRPTKQDSIHLINVLISELRDSAKSDAITRVVYKQKVDSLIIVKEELKKQMMQPATNYDNKLKRRVRRRRERKYFREPLYSISIYNILRDSIEIERDLKIDNKIIKFHTEISNISQILLNESNDIYVSGSLGGNEILLKYDSNTLENQIVFSGKYLNIVAYEIDGKLTFFTRYRRETPQMLNENLAKQEDIPNNFDSLKIVSLFNNKIFEYRTSDNYVINNERNEIKFTQIKN